MIPCIAETLITKNVPALEKRQANINYKEIRVGSAKWKVPATTFYVKGPYIDYKHLRL